MKKMNNKGLTLIEMVVTIALLSVVVTLMYTLIIWISDQINNPSYSVQNETIRTEIIKTIEEDLIANNDNSSKDKICSRITLSSDTLTYVTIKGKKYSWKLNSSATFGDKTCDKNSETGVIKININVYSQNADNESSTSNNAQDDIIITYYHIQSIASLNTSGKFATDVEENMANAITCLSKMNNGNPCGYEIEDTLGVTFTVDMGTYGTHTIRVVNLSKPSECLDSSFSQSACGVVLEFADIITTHTFNDDGSDLNGYPNSQLHNFVNNDIYNALPDVIKNVIIDTYVVSGTNSSASEKTTFSSTDKVYLLAAKEVWNTSNDDCAFNLTRQLDYYIKGYSTVKTYDGVNHDWWLRSGVNNVSESYGGADIVDNEGKYYQGYSSSKYGVSPAFRIG